MRVPTWRPNLASQPGVPAWGVRGASRLGYLLKCWAGGVPAWGVPASQLRGGVPASQILASQLRVPTQGGIGGRGVRVPTWSRKPTQTSMPIHVYSMFSLGVIEFGVLPWGPHCGVNSEYLGVCVWGVCARAGVCAQIVHELHTSVGGASGPLGVRVQANVGSCWGLCGSFGCVCSLLAELNVSIVGVLGSRGPISFLSGSIG